MAAERLTTEVRQQLGLGRILPLGEAADGVWVTEEVALGVLHRSVPGARLSAVRLDPSGPRSAAESAVPAPAGALPPGPLTLTAHLAVDADRPVPAAADEVRRTLLAAAERELGLPLEYVDLRVTELVEAGSAGRVRREEGSGPREGAEEPAPGREPAARGAGPGGRTEEPGTEQAEAADRVARAVLAVPGVVRLAPAQGPAFSHVAAGPRFSAVRIEGDPAAGPCHVLLRVTVSPEHRVLDTARAAGAAARGALGTPDGVTAAVLVAAVDRR
ncbi:hypothetical protein SAMN05421870_10140 [Streptomyces qinglanensis]|uniref:Nucleopolyhedrovirus P10 family protein n=2 Tax=Streptomyces qinglanensis TaxID=943816 RepID=A0A1H9N3W0_9ACTN|nr:hypothetical protein [Streptomyces qinglanensis]SER30093.1 hypothetical protein SAMN05421870_10140 [Streptomyces qinglanensis]